MNQIYRVIFNAASGVYQAVAENGRSQGKGSAGKVARSVRRTMRAGSIAGLASIASLFSAAALAQSLPTGGAVVAGSASIASTGNVMTITQTTPKLAANWQSFNIGATSTVNFVQPSATAIAVNRIFDTNGTQILGRLNANGQVYLVNPNGILFGQGAQVNVGSLVASTLDLNDASLSGNARAFSGPGTGSVVNQGSINAAQGGYVALLGNTVSNQGTITAPLGTVALGAGSAATLTFQDNSLVKMQVDQSVLNSLADNGGLIRADGGLVIMNAGAKNALLASVVNNTGVIEARTVENREGTIILLAGMAAGTVNVGGTLDASAPNGGNGGFIETSGANVNVADGTTITATAPYGKFGTWLLDPDVLEIIASGGTSFPLPLTGITQISTATLNTALTSANVDLQANKWIDFKTAFAYSGGRDATLGLYAPTIKLGGDISSTTNKLSLNFGGSLTVSSVTTAYAGNLFLYGGARSISTNGGTINFNGNIGGAQNLSINTNPTSGVAGAVNFNAAVNGTFDVLNTVTENLALFIKPQTNNDVVISFTTGTVTADGIALTGKNISGTFPTGTVFFPAGTVVSLDAGNGNPVKLILAGGTEQTIMSVGSGGGNGGITIPSGGLSVTQISYVVKNASGTTISATNVSYDTTTNAVKINDLVVQAGPLTLANAIAVNGNINLVTSRFVNNAGASALTDGDGVATTKNWRVWSTNADPFNVATGDIVGGLVYGFKQYNATYGTTTVLGTGNGLLYILAPILTVSLTGTVSTSQQPPLVPQLAPVSAALMVSSTVGGEANGYLEDTVVIGNQSTGENTGGLGLRLQILDGGVTLSPDSVNVNEKDKP